MAPRVIAANRLATNGKEWGKTVALKNSGTGNKQWLVISGPDKQSTPLTLWIVEQIPHLTVMSNKTDVLKNQGYWINVGVPYDEVGTIKKNFHI